MGLRVKVRNLLTNRDVIGWLCESDPDAVMKAYGTQLTALKQSIAETDADVEALRRDVADLQNRVTALEAPPPEPEPEPAPWPHPNIQSAINLAREGDIIIVPAGIYRETVLLNKRVTLRGNPGAIIDGDNLREHGVIITADGAVLEGFEVRNHITPRQQGAVQVRGCEDVFIRGCHIHHTTGACLSLYEATAFVTGCDIHDSDYLGVHGWAAHGSRIDTCRIHDNLASDDTHGWEHGGLKISGTVGLKVHACEFFSNDGPAIWADINCADWFVADCHLYDNSGPGIFYEVSSRLTANHNLIYNNGHGSPNWGEGAGIRLANAAYCHLHDNTVAWNADGLVITMQNRTDWPGHQDVINNTIENNVIAIANPSGVHNTLGLAFVWDTDNGQRSWMHSGNRAYHAHPSGPWGFGGPEGWGPNLLTWFETFDESGVWLTEAEAEAELTAAGVPTDWRTT